MHRFRFMTVTIALTGAWFALILGLQTLAWALPAAPQLSYVSQQDGANWHIHLIDVHHRIDITLTRGLFPGNARNRIPTWSPDGRHMAFVSDGGIGNHVYLLDVLTHEMRQLTDKDRTYGGISWAPDGRTLLVSTTVSANDGVQHIDIGTGAITPLELGVPAQFSPDGTTVLHRNLFGLPRLERYDRADEHITCLDMCEQVVRSMEKPRWSAAAGRIAYVYTPREHENRLRVLDAATGQARDLLAGDPLNSYLAWSPDGQQLSVSVGTYTSGYTLYLLQDMHTLPLDGTAAPQMTPVLRNGIGWLGEMAWQPDGERIALAMSTATMPQEIMVYHTRTGHTRRLTNSPNIDWAPTWRPQS